MGKRRTYGSGGLSQRKEDGRWIASVRLPTGKRITVSDLDEAEAKRKLKALHASVAAGKVSAGPDQRLSEWLANWMDGTVRRKCSASTVRIYESTIRLHIVPAIGRHKLSRLTPAHVQGLILVMQRGGASGSLMTLARAILVSALKQAMRWDLVYRNVASLVEMPRTDAPTRQALDLETWRAFRDAVRGDRLEAMYLLAVCGGMRAGELAGLTWESVDLESETLIVRAQLGYPGNKPALMPLKTAKSRRTVALPPLAVNALRRHRARQAEERVAAGAEWEDHGLVFCRTKGQPLASDFSRSHLYGLLRTAGMERVRLHELRHTYATFLSRVGTDPRTAADLLGHSNTRITMDLYTHSSLDSKRAAARALDAYLGG